MSTLSRDTSLRDGGTAPLHDWWWLQQQSESSSYLHSTIYGLCFKSARRRYYVPDNGITQASVEMQ